MEARFCFIKSSSNPIKSCIEPGFYVLKKSEHSGYCRLRILAVFVSACHVTSKIVAAHDCALLDTHQYARTQEAMSTDYTQRGGRTQLDTSLPSRARRARETSRANRAPCERLS